MQLNLFAVAISSLAFSTEALTLPSQDSNELQNAMPGNLLAEAHSYAEDDYDEDDYDYGFAETYEEDEDMDDDSQLFAQAYAAAFGDEELENMLAQADADEGFLGNIGDQNISAVDTCTAFTSEWECIASPEGCIYRDTAHECTKL